MHIYSIANSAKKKNSTFAFDFLNRSIFTQRGRSKACITYLVSINTLYYITKTKKKTFFHINKYNAEFNYNSLITLYKLVASNNACYNCNY